MLWVRNAAPTLSRNATVYSLLSISNLRHPLVFIIKKNLTSTPWGAPRTFSKNFDPRDSRVKFRKSAKIAPNLGYRHFYVKLKPTIFGLRRYNSIILDEMSKGGVFDEIKFQNFIKFEFIWIKILNFYKFSTWKNR